MRGSFLFVVLSFSSFLFSDVPRLISYQGRLTSSDGTPLVGSHTVTFRLYENETDPLGAAVWTETQSVVLNDEGLFNVLLGDVTPFPSTVDFSRMYWLGVSVDGGGEICRYALGASPYALNLYSLGASDGQVLKWSSSQGKWVPANDETGGVSGSGTTDFIPKWTSSSDIGNSNLYVSPGTLYVDSVVSAINSVRAKYFMDKDNEDYFLDPDGVSFVGNLCVTDSPLFCDAALDVNSPFWVIAFNVSGAPSLFEDKVYISWPEDTALFIDHPRYAGVVIDSTTGGTAIVVNYPENNGISIYEPGDNGIYINKTAGSGIVIDSSFFEAIYISEPSTGVVVHKSDHNGYEDDSCAWSSFVSYDASYDGFVANNPGRYGVNIHTPASDCFICDGVPHLFRVTNKCEVFGHSYNQYIVDAEGRGIVAPLSASTGRWLEHIGHAKLRDGVCRVDLPKEFVEGTTIDDENPMHVFVTPTSPMGDYWVEKGDTYFIVHQVSGGRPDATFDYRVVAKVWGCEGDRVEPVDIREFVDPQPRR